MRLIVLPFRHAVQPAASALRLTFCLCATLAASPVPAGEKPLSASDFDALTQGTTFDTYSYGSVYGIEKFLPNRRSLWEDADGCKYGTWAQVGEQICFYYEDNPADPDCWIYVNSPDGILGFYGGNMDEPPITLLPSASGLTCDEYIGA